RGVMVAAGMLVVFGAPLVVGALLARGPVTRGVAEAQGALASVTGGGGSTARSALTQARNELAAGAGRVDPWWTAGAALVPVEAQQRHAIVASTTAAAGVLATAEGVVGHLGALHSSYHDGHLDLAAIAALAAPVHRLDLALGAAQRRLAHAGSPWLVPPVAARLDLLTSRLDSAASSTRLADEAIPVLPGVLGAHGTRHYFIAFMTPSESRGLDGFIGSYGELTATDGHLSLTRNGPITQLSNMPGPRKITGPASYLARYGAFDPAHYLQDVSYSPSFPTVANVIAQLYPQVGGDHLDGVLAIDPFALAALLNFTGPITVAGLPETLTAANAASVLTLGQYESTGSSSQANVARHDALDAALQAAFTKLTAGSLPSPRALSATLDPVVRQGRLLFWTFHRREQPLLRKLGLSGAFPSPRHQDLLAVTTQNADNNKIDAFLTRQINDRVRFDPATGAVSSIVTISLHNAAPASGLPVYVIGSYPGSGIPLGANLTWMSLYSPLSLTRATIAGAPMPTRSIRELGLNTYSGYVLVPAGQTVTVTVDLAGHVAKGAAYGLAWREQPMVHPDQASVELTGAGGWIPLGARHGVARWNPPPVLSARWYVSLATH
ncbi:MAG: DUF4012 domain-containing protein, partial [Acidimicrobiales bacterium]